MSGGITRVVGCRAYRDAAVAGGEPWDALLLGRITGAGFRLEVREESGGC